MTHYLVVCATEAEAAHVPAGLPLVVTGIGKTAAATGTTRALADLAHQRPQGLSGVEVLNVGTAGALHAHLEGLHLPGLVLNHDLNAAAIRALGYEPHERLPVPGGDETVLATGDVFVTDPDRAAALAQQADLVDMEGYAVVWAARAFDVPVRLIKHVSDHADDSAWDWPTQVADSARVLGEWLAREL